jgi:hypothetical protein
MLDDTGRTLAVVARIDEDGKPEGFAGSIEMYAYKRAVEMLKRAKAISPKEAFAIDRVTRERVEVL